MIPIAELIIQKPHFHPAAYLIFLWNDFENAIFINIRQYFTNQYGSSQVGVT